MPRGRIHQLGDGEGRLNSFLSPNGPLGATIKTSLHSSPDKTASTLSWSAQSSPISIASNIYGEDHDHSVSSFFKIQQQTDNDSLLRVQVESSVQKTTFYVPVSLMLQREMEMEAAAKATNIDKDRWSSSRLYSLWKNQLTKQDEVTLRLTPEASMKEYSILKWKPWLTTCIRAYYNTGTIRIPEDCLGSDILLALEYFGILTTSPDTFVFDSYPAYERIKSWSAYYTYRNVMTNWVLADYRMKGGASKIWVASEDPVEMLPSETLLQVDGETACGLVGGLEGFGPKVVSCKEVHDLFSDTEESDNQLTRESPGRIRLDFCHHLLRSLPPKTKVSFETEKAKIVTARGRCATDLRPVLRIQREPEPPMDLRIQREPEPAMDRQHQKQQTKGVRQPESRDLPSRESSSAKEESRSSPPNVIGPSMSPPASYGLPSGSSAPRLLMKGSSGTDIADVIALGEGTSEMMRFKHSENGIFGADSLELSETPSSSQKQGTAFGSKFSNYQPGPEDSAQSDSEGPIVVNRSRSASLRESSASGISSSRPRPSKNSNLGYSTVEERHPQRSSPPLDDKRASPVDFYKPTIPDPISERKQTISDQEFLQQIDAAVPAPIRFLNMSFGDLRSVTSGLSGPFMDDSTIGELQANDSNVQSAKRMALERAKGKVNKVPVETIHEGSPVKSIPRQLQMQKAKGKDKKSGNESESDCWNAAYAATDYRYWEQFLASVFEAVVPGGPHNERASSPVCVTPGLEANPVNLDCLAEPPTDVNDPNFEWLQSQMVYGSKCKGEAEKASEGSYLRTASEEDDLPNALSYDSSLMENAKIMGNTISSTVDDFMQLAHHAAEEVRLSFEEEPKKSAIPADLPMPPKRSASKRSAIPANLPMPSRQANSNRVDVPAGRSRSMSSHEFNHRGKQSDPKQMRPRGESNMRETASRAAGLPLTNSRSSSSSSPSPTGYEIHLPPREPRRVRSSREEPTIARKKQQSAQAKPPRHPYNDIVGISLSHNSSKTQLTAKVKNTKSGRASPASSKEDSVGSKGSRRKGLFGRKL